MVRASQMRAGYLSFELKLGMQRYVVCIHRVVSTHRLPCCLGGVGLKAMTSQSKDPAAIQTTVTKPFLQRRN